jgi:transketolase
MLSNQSPSKSTSKSPTQSPWNELDEQAVKTARVLAMDAVQKVGNGHPGTAMSLAPIAYTLFQRILRHDPANPNWFGRDRFVLSCGHSSLTLYIQLFLAGYGVELEDLQEFRTFGSITPGHPEYGHTVGVETTTGPLGQGVANAVGMAMAARFVTGLLANKSNSEKDKADCQQLFSPNIWVLCSDGDLQEGISAEASSLAGTQALGNLKVIYDDNRISIEGDTHLTFTEDVPARYKSYGWKVFEVDKLTDGNVDRAGFEQAAISALAINNQPVLIRLKSVIAWPAPAAQGTAKSHGSALGADEVAKTKKILGFNPDLNFEVDAKVLAHTRNVKDRGTALYKEWQNQFENWRKSNSEAAKLFDQINSKELTSNLTLPTFSPDKENKGMATRSASGQVINEIAKQLPHFWGGSADLADSNNTTIEHGGSFLPSSSKVAGANPTGRIIHFGIREHAMGAIANGIALFGGTKVFVGTFLVFSDYMRGAVRLSALMNLPVTYIWSHDSIGLGEDGPTHQPVEHLAALRAIPNLDVVRPADANEVSVAWRQILKNCKAAGLILSRQNLPILDRTKYADPANTKSGVAQGAYVIRNCDGQPKALILATGSEVAISITAAEQLESKGIPVRVISFPCFEWFEQQSESYRNSILPDEVPVRVSVEAGIAQPWYKYLGSSGKAISLEHFGASASAGKLFTEFGFTPENIVNTVQNLLIGK